MIYKINGNHTVIVKYLTGIKIMRSHEFTKNIIVYLMQKSKIFHKTIAFKDDYQQKKFVKSKRRIC